uniref:Uncharacterized protein n=1 Tax=Lepeophtheirus salmonis TaxID=72036 RepID=A0A0K2U1L5_LEPSM
MILKNGSNFLFLYFHFGCLTHNTGFAKLKKTVNEFFNCTLNI